ncbi:hypothetical protein JOE30_001232 [Rhodococcus sp. PvP016]|uniref:Uncharacterized protein n=1 Tax=Rhodococcoides corynebacterioides TaxID=53972 RepID=A0ABS2KZ33_9NOCA|nr:hypothetical protein [Rhodococcus corynebacterioides]MBP1115435.1 hypothetical protein [Rhodococcus sp. PvP016]
MIMSTPDEKHSEPSGFAEATGPPDFGIVPTRRDSGDDRLADPAEQSATGRDGEPQQSSDA